MSRSSYWRGHDRLVVCSRRIGEPLAQRRGSLADRHRDRSESWLLVATFEGDDMVRAEPFDAIELRLAGLRAR
jgi:hypothetical protein